MDGIENKLVVELLGTKGTWREVANSANTTIGKEAGEKEPSTKWKRRMLLCEHSPIRQLLVKCKWSNLASWVSVHFVRHKYGIEHWVKTQRPDRLVDSAERSQAPQDTPIDHEFEANAQAIIYISRKRLCRQARPETRGAWKAFLAELQKAQPELYRVCVPDCIYRGYCYEFKSCDYFRTSQYEDELRQYRAGINE